MKSFFYWFFFWDSSRTFAWDSSGRRLVCSSSKSFKYSKGNFFTNNWMHYWRNFRRISESNSRSNFLRDSSIWGGISRNKFSKASQIPRRNSWYYCKKKILGEIAENPRTFLENPRQVSGEIPDTIPEKIRLQNTELIPERSSGVVSEDPFKIFSEILSEIYQKTLMLFIF